MKVQFFLKFRNFQTSEKILFNYIPLIKIIATNAHMSSKITWSRKTIGLGDILYQFHNQNIPLYLICFQSTDLGMQVMWLLSTTDSPVLI